MHPSLPIVAVKSIFWRDYVHKVVSYKSGVSDVVYVLFWFMFVCFVFLLYLLSVEPVLRGQLFPVSGRLIQVRLFQVT